jgi:Glycosyltransferases involved in cell wall biogenesis
MNIHCNVRVSVVISVFNAERFLRQTIESVLSQTFTHWELFLVDDGSSDSSPAIAKGFASQFPEAIHYLEHEGHRRRGQCASRNLAIKHSKGEFIATLDHDDIWLPNKLERQIAILDAHPDAAMVYGATHYWHDWAGDIKGQRRDYLQLPGVDANRVYEPMKLLRLHLSEKIVPPLPTDFMLRKKVAIEIGGFEESFIGAMSTFEDQAFLVKVYSAFSVYVSNETWDRYRIHPNQHCARMWLTGRQHDAELFYLSWTWEYLECQGLLNAEFRAQLNRRLWPHRHSLLGRIYWSLKRNAARLKWRLQRRSDQQEPAQS